MAFAGGHRYGADTATPYPILFTDPGSPTYNFLLNVATKWSEVLATVHDVTGMPWWATVVVRDWCS